MEKEIGFAVLNKINSVENLLYVINGSFNSGATHFNISTNLAGNAIEVTLTFVKRQTKLEILEDERNKQVEVLMKIDEDILVNRVIDAFNQGASSYDIKSADTGVYDDYMESAKARLSDCGYCVTDDKVYKTKPDKFIGDNQ